MSNPIPTTGATDNQSVQQQQSAGSVTSETSITTDSAPVQQQYQIQPNVSNADQATGNQQSAATTTTTAAAAAAAYIQQQYVQQSSPSTNTMPQQGGMVVPPNVTPINFATPPNQQSDNNNIPLADKGQQQSPPSIQPLLSLEPDQGDAKQINQNDVPTTNHEQEQKSQQQTSPQKTLVKVKMRDDLNIFDWFRTTDIINQLAEKAKSSVDSVITALDPGMKEYLYSGGNINILVISDFDSFVSPIRDVFQTVFGRATVSSAKIGNSQELLPSFPIRIAHGFNEAIRVAQEKIKQLRLDTSNVPQNQVMIAVQPSIVHVIDNSDAIDDSETLHGLKLDENIFTSCYLTYCLVLEDPVLGLTLTSFSQLIPLDAEAMSTLNQNKLPDDSPHHNLGYTITIDDMMNARLKIMPYQGLDGEWLQKWAGLEILQVVQELGSSLAHMYRRKWTDCVSQ